MSYFDLLLAHQRSVPLFFVAGWDKYCYHLDIFVSQGVQMVGPSVLLFYSTFFPIIRHKAQSDNGERRRTQLPRSRGPPVLLKSRLSTISEEQEVCPMRQLYIRGLRRNVNDGVPANPSYISHICANRSICIGILLQNAEFIDPGEKLFLIRSAASGLTVILPNMDRMAGGELE